MIESDSGLEAKFTLESERGGVIEEPPFRILVLGDWSGAAARKDLGQRRPIEIDRDNFDEVLGRFAPRAELRQPGSSPLTLDFSSLDDFHPDRIFERLPIFEKMRDLRSGLLSAGSFNSAAREVRSLLNIEEESRPAAIDPGPTAASSENLLDAILSGSSGSAPAPRREGTSDEIASLISGLVRPHLVAVDENEQSALLAAVDAATSDLMRHVLHDHGFQALEAAWRALYLLVRRTETGTDLKIYIYDVSKDELSADLKSVGNLTESKLYDVVVRQAVEMPGADPWGIVIGNYAFAPNKDDVAALMRIAKIEASADSPFISHMRPDILGIASLAEHPNPSEWKLSLDTDSGKLWSALRGIPEAKYLGMTTPRYLARLPYGRESDPLETFSFEEFTGIPEHDKYLWANSCFISALLFAQSFSAFGWQMNQRFIQDVERLPMHTYEVGNETFFQPCAEVLLTEKACDRLMESGLMSLVSYKNTDHVKLARFQSISEPVTALNGRWT